MNNQSMTNIDIFINLFNYLVMSEPSQCEILKQYLSLEETVTAEKLREDLTGFVALCSEAGVPYDAYKKTRGRGTAFVNTACDQSEMSGFEITGREPIYENNHSLQGILYPSVLNSVKLLNARRLDKCVSVSYVWILIQGDQDSWYRPMPANIRFAHGKKYQYDHRNQDLWVVLEDEEERALDAVQRIDPGTKQAEFLGKFVISLDSVLSGYVDKVPEAVELYRSGLSLRDVTEKSGVSGKTVQNWIKAEETKTER